MKRQTFDNVWSAIEGSEADAATMNMKSELMTLIEGVIARWNLPQAEAATRLGLTRPRFNDLLRGKIRKSSHTRGVRSEVKCEEGGRERSGVNLQVGGTIQKG